MYWEQFVATVLTMAKGGTTWSLSVVADGYMSAKASKTFASASLWSKDESRFLDGRLPEDAIGGN